MALLADSPPLAPPAVRRGSTAPAPPRDRVTAPTSAGRCVLAGANWEMYRQLRDEPANARFKLTYDGPSGRLEIEMPQGPRHETVSRLIYALILAFRQAGGPRFRATGGVTLAREDLDRGLECDESFYVSSLDRAPDLTTNTLDLSDGGLPPDLAIEVDVTSPGVEKLPIYAALGVPEVWVWNAADGSLAAHRLSEAGGYASVTESMELPGFPLAVAAELIRDRGDRDDGELQAAFAERLRQVFGEDVR